MVSRFTDARDSDIVEVEKVSKWKNDTQEIPIDRYISVRDRFYALFRDDADVVCFGSFGSVNSPGLSDLDLIVVVKDQALAERSFSLPDILEDEQYILTHPPMVVPHSLMQYLPYYHLLNINWEDSGPEIQHYVEFDSETLGCLHILKKTLYLQSVLWELILGKRYCRRAFMALTSLVRSVEWLESFNIPVREVDKVFAESLLDLRKEWIKPAVNMNELIERLDTLLYSGLEIAIIFPERVSSHMLALENGKRFHPNRRCMQISPMRFLLEDDVLNAKNIIERILRKRPIFRISRCFGKYQSFIKGVFSVVGPQTFAIMAYNFPEASKYRKHIGQKQWETNQYPAICRAIETRLQPLLLKEFQTNMGIVEILAQAGLSRCYMGSEWMIPGFRGFILRVLGKTLGSMGFIQLLQKDN
ncbi:hypothetical protein ACFL1R_04000 [Candidatus Latescibacterota bacterium]